jgi:hypothetical protein
VRIRSRKSSDSVFMLPSMHIPSLAATVLFKML